MLVSTSGVHHGQSIVVFDISVLCLTRICCTILVILSCSLLQLLIPALLHLKLQQNMAQRRATFSFCERPAVLKLLLDFMMDVLLLPYK